MYTFNLSGICVLCLNDNDNLRSLLNDKSDISIINKIEFLISSDLLLLLPDNPECICSSCNRKLNSFYTFKQMCLENGRRLKYYMKRKLENAINSSSSKNNTNEFEEDEYLRITGITEEEIEDAHLSDEDFTLFIDDDDDEEPVTACNEENAEFVTENTKDDETIPVLNEAEILPKNKNGDQSICDDTQKNNSQIIDLSMRENIDIKEEFIEEPDDDNRTIYNNYLRAFDSNISEENQNLNSVVDENIARYSEFRGTVDKEICHSSISESDDNNFQPIMNQSVLENMTNECLVNKQLLPDTVNNKTIDSNVSKAPINMIMEKKTEDSELNMQVLIKTIITESVNTFESNSNSVLKITTKENTETTKSNDSQNTTKDAQVNKKFLLETGKNNEFKIFKSPENSDNTITESKKNKRLRLDTTNDNIYEFNNSESTDNIVLHNSTEESDTNEEFKFPCTFCDKSYRKKGHFTRHVKTHSPIQPPKIFYKCDVCQKKFQRKPNLKRHMDSHSEKTSACMICDLIFLETNMKEHLKEHRFKYRKDEEENVENVSTEDVIVETVNTDEENKEIQKENVEKAEKINVEMFKCTVCQYEFNRKSSLVNHLRTHMDKKIKIKMFASRKRLREWE